MLEKTLQELMRLESVNPSTDRVVELINILSEKLPFPYRYQKENGKFVLFSNCNLLTETEDKEIFMICNHFDTVAPAFENFYAIMTPVEGEEEGLESWVLGRGSVDDKPNTAIMIDLLEDIKKSNKVIIYGITFDEETEVQGAKQIVETLQELNVKPDNILLVEPTNMNPSCNCQGSIDGHYWNRLEQDENEIFLFKKLKEMNMGYSMLITPPCEAGDYKKLGSNVVVCGPGYTNLCHTSEEKIEISSLYEWKNRMKWLIENNLK